MRARGGKREHALAKRDLSGVGRRMTHELCAIPL